ncbi:MAG: isoamylase early set domain-containing protein [Candidatus Eisenbacteria bacterium]|nr:isoamylase early set domain-containing protein [Candidatus Eisenbacteria bacterium]
MAFQIPLRSARHLALATALAAFALGPAPAAAAPQAVAGGIRFTYSAPNANTVAWAGEFNAWSPSANPLTKGDGGVWSVVIPLKAGEHPYKFVVDGQWFADPENPVTVGEFGNSVVRVGEDGALVKQAATSNTAYSPKITIDGRVHSLTYVAFDPVYSRYEIVRPTFDVDLGFGIRISDLLKARVLTNIDPQKEDVQDYRSRLNFKRGSMDFAQPGLKLFAFSSETIPTWDDPARLVGDVGIYAHPFGYQRDGFLLGATKFGFDGQLLYADNSATGGTEFPGTNKSDTTLFGGRFPIQSMDFSINRGTNRQFVFEADPISAAWKQLRTVRRDSVTFALVQDQFSKLTATDIGDGGAGFGFGDGASDVFATSLRRTLANGLRLGVLGRTDRGFHLGRLSLTRVTSDSTGILWFGQTEQQSFAGGGEARLPLRNGSSVWGEYLQGARRLDMMDRGTRVDFVATGITGTGPSAIRVVNLTTPMGQHFNLDESARLIAGGTWSLAGGDVVLTAEFERQTHTYPAWAMPPVAPAGLANTDHPRFENVDFQRGTYVGQSDLENRMTEWRLRWDRNWRYYLGREVRTSVGLELTDFRYDARTAWEYQMWFPTGNMWLQQDGQVVGVDRLTLLCEDHAYRLTPSLEVPIRRARNVDFHWRGDFTGVKLGLRPRYAENVFQLGFDLTRSLRFSNDTRWVKYDAPALKLDRAYVSNFAQVDYRIAEGIHVAMGWGVSPRVLDPVTNEFANIGREQYLYDRNVNGWIAESNWLSLAPQISAAEKALQNERRLHLEAVVHF